MSRRGRAGRAGGTTSRARGSGEGRPGGAGRRERPAGDAGTAPDGGPRPSTEDVAAAGELVATVLGTVSYAPAGQAADDALESGASALTAAPAGIPAVSAALLAAAVRRVRWCWDNGWMPADLDRVVRRDLTAAGPHPDRPAAVVVDAVAAEALLAAAEARRAGSAAAGSQATGAKSTLGGGPSASPPPQDHVRATRGPRWAGQLRTLGAEGWWGEDRAYLDALARRQRTTRFESAYDILRALRVLARQPRIAPLPGGFGGGTGHAGAGSEQAPGADRAESRVLGRIRGLLAKAEATTFAEEAEALSAKAQELMARHSIEEALLSAGGGARGGGAPSAVRVGVEGPYEEAKALLLDAVAGANRCRAVWSQELCFTTLVGYPADVEAVELLHASLLLQATAAMRRAGDAHHARGRSRRTREFRQTFLVAYADRIRVRLAEATGRVTREATEEASGLLPVLASREVAVEETARELFPTTTTVRLRGVRDADGWREGARAADHAHLSHGTDPDRRELRPGEERGRSG